MNRGLLLVLVLVIGIPCALFFALAISTSHVAKRVTQKKWADGGTIATVPEEFPAREANEGAKTLTELGVMIGIPFAESGERQEMVGLEEYLQAQHRREDATIELPADHILQLIGEQSDAIDHLRDFLLSGEEVVWDLDLLDGFDPPHPDGESYLQAARLLTARAYVLAHDEDPAAWDELHAAWQLARHLNARPEARSQWVAGGIARGVNAASWKMPLPPPVWLEELRTTDYDRLRFRAARVEAFLMLTHGESPFAPMRPIGRYMVVRAVEGSRMVSLDVAKLRECGGDVHAIVEKRFRGAAALLRGMMMYTEAWSWQRVFLFRAEREAAANALRAAAGEPIVAQSVCADGRWSIVDGRLTFSGNLATKFPDELVMPLSLKVRAAQ